MKAKAGIVLVLFALTAGCASLEPPASDPAAVSATSVASFEQEFRLRETAIAGGSFMHEPNCLSIPSTFTLVRGHAEAEWSSNSPFTETMTLEALGRVERGVLATTTGASPLRIEFGKVPADPEAGGFAFYLVLDHDGQSVDQPAKMRVEVEVEGSEAPDFEVLKCAVS